jgi:hypothetical protein
VRLGTCIAIELTVGIASLTAVATGAWVGFGAIRHHLQAEHVGTTEREPVSTPWVRPAAAAAVEVVAPSPEVVALAEPGLVAAAVELPTAEIAEPPHLAKVVAAPAAVDTAFGSADEVLLQPLIDAAPARIKANRGGSSLSLRIDFASGARGSFKPEQIHLHSNPRRELAAYRVDRLLGIGRVPPAVARVFPAEQLRAAVDPSARGVLLPRIDQEVIARGGTIAGVVSWWIPRIVNATIDGFEVDSTEGVVTWRRLLRVGAIIPERHREMVAQLSAMTLFDFLIDNTDRWSGANVKRAPDSPTLYFMDNTMSFTSDPKGHRRSRLYLERVQVFSKQLVQRLRTVSEVQLRADLEVARGPLSSVLTDVEIKAFGARRDAALDYIDRLVARHGEQAILVFP